MGDAGESELTAKARQVLADRGDAWAAIVRRGLLRPASWKSAATMVRQAEREYVRARRKLLSFKASGVGRICREDLAAECIVARHRCAEAAEHMRQAELGRACALLMAGGSP